MGGSNSIVQNKSKKGFESVFVSDKLLCGCLNLKTDAKLRKSFVDFIKDGEWLDDLINDCQSYKEKDTILNEYQCVESFDVLNRIPFTRGKSISDKTSSSTSDAEDDEDIRMYELSSLFSTENEIKAFIICSLYPVFIQNSQDNHSNTSKLNQHTLELLLQGASMFDDEVFVSYLSNPESSIIHDLYSAIENIPIHLRVYNSNITTTSDTISSMIVYSNRYEDYSKDSNTGTIPHTIGSTSTSITSIDNNILPQYTNYNATCSKTSTNIRAIITTDSSVSDCTTILAHLPITTTDNTQIYTIVAEYTSPVLSMKLNKQQAVHTYNNDELLKGIALVENLLALIPGIIS